MKKLFSKEGIGSVFQSLVASLIVIYLIQPTIEIGKNLGKGIIKSFFDYFFYSCARASGIDFVNYIAFNAILWFAFYMIDHFLSTGFPRTEKKKFTKDNEGKNNDVNPQNSRKHPKDPKSEIERLERMLKIISTIATIVWVLFLCNIIIFQYAPVVVKNTFDRRVVQVTPYIEAEEVDLLKSEWVSMESREDYVLISKKIDDILAKNNLE